MGKPSLPLTWHLTGGPKKRKWIFQVPSHRFHVSWWEGIYRIFSPWRGCGYVVSSPGSRWRAGCRAVLRGRQIRVPLGKAALLWMDKIHFAPPKKPWNDSIPLQIPTNRGFAWFPSDAISGFCNHPQGSTSARMARNQFDDESHVDCGGYSNPPLF